MLVRVRTLRLASSTEVSKKKTLLENEPKKQKKKVRAEGKLLQNACKKSSKKQLKMQSFRARTHDELLPISFIMCGKILLILMTLFCNHVSTIFRRERLLLP